MTAEHKPNLAREESQLTEEERNAKWQAMCDAVTDRMKVFTRPYVCILAGGTLGEATEIGTGTFIDSCGVELLTCEHVAQFNPTAIYVDANGSSKLDPGAWRSESNPNRDVALAPVPATKWSDISTSARALPMSKFAPLHAPVEHEVLFFRGVAGENAYISNFGADAILTGYCSQEEIGTGDADIFEIMWEPPNTIVTAGTSDEVRARVKYDNPAGFSGSLVWNTRFVELGCDLRRWSPNQAVVTGLLRRFDSTSKTLLAWRVEHLRGWL
ncbi:hypothetical protein EN851_20240 [Mesorhizobium sp. M8A.F.Ca.ET.208.01.1.1]|uniref:hypothetical protein n=1 Tax=unclassified Mesorhizobium TaxID=325217 RepID=UPI00109345E1|nr:MULTISPECIES: hypothetical protein [unclassified Mesorhizobium]TGQ89968.1 hypothetical protein EN851_20240 [Mesorhizobium sp. M8A.F.Ca.ET.208.01.1.1]TGT50807.1 hypothetical protein EN810_20140 [Mesorhizobium sp. M8A.F.Ca.ET.167.01.1.1]